MERTVDIERGKKLLEKWSNIIDYSSNKSPDESYKERLKNAVVLESKETWWKDCSPEEKQRL